MRETEATKETMRENKKASRNKRKECVHKVSHSVVPNSATPWTVARQALLFMVFPRKEYWPSCIWIQGIFLGSS